MPEKKARKRAPSKAQRKPTLRWLKIHQLRHVEPCELHFSDTYNVLLGLNGTGKTTLLEIIAAALSFNFSKMKKEAFFIEYEIELPEASIRASIRNERLSSGSLDAALDHFSATAAPLAPSAEIVITPSSEAPQVSIRVRLSGSEIETVGASKGVDWLRATSLFDSSFLPGVWAALVGSSLDGSKTLLDVHATWHKICRFDEALGFLRLVTGSSTRILAVRDRGEVVEGGVGGRGPIPVSLAKELERQARDWGRSVAPLIIMTSAQVGLLSNIARMLGFESVELRFTQLETEVAETFEHSSFGDLKFMLEREDGSVVSHKLLSYGQKRALSFLYYLAVNDRTVIADELVDGLHHGWIVECIEAIGDRQCFLASQNPLLLDYLEFKSVEQVRTSFIQCRLKKQGKTERMVWSNMTEYDAARFYEAYGVGLQHVSEILRTKGLW